jgi:hypothetical protein
MPLIFSPVDEQELDSPYQPRPRTAFVMMQLNPKADEREKFMAAETKAVLRKAGFSAVTASDVTGTGDFLIKIVDLIRSCGFAVAIFSDKTPAKTLANIFFEVGIATVLGKPIQLLLTGDNPAPSDFVRSEWISYTPGKEKEFRATLAKGLERIGAMAEYYTKLGQVALDAQNADLELAFERFKQAILIGDHAGARKNMKAVVERLEGHQQAEGNDDMASHRERLHRTATQFLKLLPKASRATTKAPRAKTATKPRGSRKV